MCWKNTALLQLFSIYNKNITLKLVYYYYTIEHNTSHFKIDWHSDLNIVCYRDQSTTKVYPRLENFIINSTCNNIYVKEG